MIPRPRHCLDGFGSCLELDDAHIEDGVRADEPEGAPPNWGGPAEVLGIRR